MAFASDAVSSPATRLDENITKPSEIPNAAESSAALESAEVIRRHARNIAGGSELPLRCTRRISHRTASVTTPTPATSPTSGKAMTSASTSPGSLAAPTWIHAAAATPTTGRNHANRSDPTADRRARNTRLEATAVIVAATPSPTTATATIEPTSMTPALGRTPSPGAAIRNHVAATPSAAPIAAGVANWSSARAANRQAASPSARSSRTSVSRLRTANAAPAAVTSNPMAIPPIAAVAIGWSSSATMPAISSRRSNTSVVNVGVGPPGPANSVRAPTISVDSVYERSIPRVCAAWVDSSPTVSGRSITSASQRTNPVTPTSRNTDSGRNIVSKSGPENFRE